MRFDSEGNLYLYEPGAGMSGQPRRVIEFGSDEVIYADGDKISDKCSKHKSVMDCETFDSMKVYCMSSNKNAAVITKRYF